MPQKTRVLTSVLKQKGEGEGKRGGGRGRNSLQEELALDCWNAVESGSPALTLCKSTWDEGGRRPLDPGGSSRKKKTKKTSHQDRLRADAPVQKEEEDEDAILPTSSRLSRKFVTHLFMCLE